VALQFPHRERHANARLAERLARRPDALALPPSDTARQVKYPPSRRCQMEKIIAEGFLLTHSEIASDKIDAYQATHYRVGYGENAFSLRIGTRSEALLRLYEATKQTCGVFITAFNPYGTVQLDEVNEVAHARLGEHFRAIAPHVIEGAGDDQIGVWPEEKSFFALGVNEDVARLLGNRFHQDAVVWTGPDAIPRLLLLR
jgi:hypothetical protein